MQCNLINSNRCRILCGHMGSSRRAGHCVKHCSWPRVHLWTKCALVENCISLNFLYY